MPAIITPEEYRRNQLGVEQIPTPEGYRKTSQISNIPTPEEYRAKRQITQAEREGHWEGWVKPTLKEVGKIATVGTAETAMGLASPLVTWPAGKLSGLVHSIWGGEAARAAEEDTMATAYQPITPEAQKSVELIGKLFHYGLWPARKAGEELTKMGYPRLGYYLETAGELATFQAAHGVGARIKARGKPTLKPTKKPLAGLKEKPRLVKPKEKPLAELVKAEEKLIKARPKEVKAPPKLEVVKPSVKLSQLSDYDLKAEIKARTGKPKEKAQAELLSRMKGQIPLEKAKKGPTLEETTREIGKAKPPPEVTAEQGREYLPMLLKEVKQGEPGRRIKTVDADGRETWSGQKTTYPEFMRGKNWTGVKVAKAIEKGMAGEKLGPEQQRMFEAAIEEGKVRHTQDVAEVGKIKAEQSSGIFDAKKPPTSDNAISAIRMEDGTVFYDKTAKVHADMLDNLRIDTAEIKDVGFITREGKYREGGGTIMPRVVQAKAREAIRAKRAARLAKKPTQATLIKKEAPFELKGEEPPPKLVGRLPRELLFEKGSKRWELEPGAKVAVLRSRFDLAKDTYEVKMPDGETANITVGPKSYIKPIYPKAVIPTEKIPTATKGEQVSLLPKRKGEQVSLEERIEKVGKEKPIETEFVTEKQWQSYALRIEKGNLRERGESLTFSSIARRAKDHIVEIQGDRKGMIVTKGWREAMKKEPQLGKKPPPINLMPDTRQGVYANVILQDKAGKVYEGDVSEHMKLATHFRIKPEDIARYGIIEESGRYKWKEGTPSNVKQWNDILRMQRRGESEAILETFPGFQQMYEAFGKRMKAKKAKEKAPKIDVKVFDTGKIVKERKFLVAVDEPTNTLFGKRRIKKRIAAKAPPIYEGEAKVLKEIPDLPKEFLDYKLQNPPRVFDELGPDYKEMFYRPILEARDRVARGNKIFQQRIKELKKGVPFKSYERIQTYAIAQQYGGKARLAAQGIKEIPKLTGKERAIYHEQEIIYKTLYIRLNEARRLSGKAPFPSVKHYAPFIHDLGLIDQMGFNPIFDKPMVINELFLKLKTTPFRHAKPRAEFVPQKLNLDCFDVMQRYGYSAINHIQMSPTIAKLREYMLTIGKDKWKMIDHAPRTAEWLNAWINFQAGQTPFRLPAVLERGLRKLNKNALYAILSWNARSALIQPSAMLQGYVMLGEKYTALGMESLLHPSKRNFALEKSKHLMSRDFDVAYKDAFDLIKGGKIMEGQKSAGKLGLKLLKILDMETAKATWQGAYQKGIKELKYTEAKAIQYADDITIKTQASGAPQDVAPIQRTILGRTATLFQTFVINEWNFMVKDVLGYKKAEVSKAQAGKNIIRFIVGTTLINAFYEDVLGLNSPYPSPINAYQYAKEQGKEPLELTWAVIRELVEKVPIIGGARYRGSIAGASLEAVGKVVKGQKLPETIGTLIGVPGTIQAGKSLRARKRGESTYGQIVGAYTKKKGKLKKPKYIGLTPFKSLKGFE